MRKEKKGRTGQIMFLNSRKRQLTLNKTEEGEEEEEQNDSICSYHRPSLTSYPNDIFHSIKQQLFDFKTQLKHK